MGFIFKGILAVIWLLVVPCLAGEFYFRREKRTCSEYLLAGYTLLFAITELLSLIMIFTKQPLHLLTATYGVTAGVLAFLGVWSLYKKRQKETGKCAGTYCSKRAEESDVFKPQIGNSSGLKSFCRRMEFPRSLWWQEF